MKKNKVVCFFICFTMLLLNLQVPVLAMDGFDMINDMNMDMMLEQSYHTIDSAEFATDHAMDNNLLSHQMDNIMFFPDLLDVTNNANNPNQSTINNTFFDDTIVAVNNGVWMPEFNNFFDNPTAQIPVDIEMMNVDMNSVTVPVFQSMPQDTIKDLNNNPDMNQFNNDSSLNNNSELDFSTAPDSSSNLEWNMETNPEKALLEVAQPENNTNMLEAPNGEITDNGLNNELTNDNTQDLNLSWLKPQDSKEVCYYCQPIAESLIP